MKRLAWALHYKDSVYKWKCLKKKGTQPKPKPRLTKLDFSCFIQSFIYYRHKLHVWGGISWKGPTPIVIFEGKMNGAGYIEVVNNGLI